MPEPETFKAVVEPDGLVWRIGGVLATACGAIIAFLFNRVISKHDDEIERIVEAIGTKASREEQERIRNSIGRLFEQQREDKTEILSAIRELGGNVDLFKTTVLTALGDRPTRTELGQMNQGPKRRNYDQD